LAVSLPSKVFTISFSFQQQNNVTVLARRSAFFYLPGLGTGSLADENALCKAFQHAGVSVPRDRKKIKPSLPI
jgi:hypothetical protein